MERQACIPKTPGDLLSTRPCGRKPQQNTPTAVPVMEFVPAYKGLDLMGDAVVAGIEQHALAGEVRRQGFDRSVGGKRDGRAIPHQGNSLGWNARHTQAPPLILAQDLEAIDPTAPEVRKSQQQAQGA